MDYDTWLANSPLEFKKKLIQTFTENTVSYARSHITTRLNEISGVIPEEVEIRLERIRKWLAYIEFQEHTLAEIQGEKIDNLIP